MIRYFIQIEEIDGRTYFAADRKDKNCTPSEEAIGSQLDQFLTVVTKGIAATSNGHGLIREKGKRPEPPSPGREPT